MGGVCEDVARQRGFFIDACICRLHVTEVDGKDTVSSLKKLKEKHIHFAYSGASHVHPCRYILWHVLKNELCLRGPQGLFVGELCEPRFCQPDPLPGPPSCFSRACSASFVL